MLKAMQILEISCVEEWTEIKPCDLSSSQTSGFDNFADHTRLIVHLSKENDYIKQQLKNITEEMQTDMERKTQDYKDIKQFTKDVAESVDSVRNDLKSRVRKEIGPLKQQLEDMQKKHAALNIKKVPQGLQFPARDMETLNEELRKEIDSVREHFDDVIEEMQEDINKVTDDVSDLESEVRDIRDNEAVLYSTGFSYR